MIYLDTSYTVLICYLFSSLQTIIEIRNAIGTSKNTLYGKRLWTPPLRIMLCAQRHCHGTSWGLLVQVKANCKLQHTKTSHITVCDQICGNKCLEKLHHMWLDRMDRIKIQDVFLAMKLKLISFEPKQVPFSITIEFQIT